jgi:chromosome partitioning protein
MKKIVIFANQKGGVGKTSTCRETGLYLGRKGIKLLFIDADPQGNLTRGLIDDESKNGLYEALTDGKYELKAVTDNIKILSGDNRLTGLSKSLTGEIDGNTRLKEVLLRDEFKQFDLIFIDSRPAFDPLTINGLSSCTDVIIPMSCGQYTLQGTNDLLTSIAKVKSNFNPAIRITGVIINAYDGRPVIIREIREEIEEVFTDKVFKTMLSKTIRFEEAIDRKVGVIELKGPESVKIREEIGNLGDELLTRLAL